MTMPPFPQEGYPRPGHPEDPPWTPWAQAVHAAAAAVTTGRLADAELRAAFEAGSAVTLYVVAGGSDSNTGRLLSAPKATIQGAHDALPSTGGRIVVVGQVNSATPIVMTKPFILEGAGPGARVNATTGHLFNVTSAWNRCVVRDIILSANSGHIITVATGQSINLCSFYNVVFTQAANDRSIVNMPDGGMVDNLFLGCESNHTPTATVPSFNLSTSTGALNANTWRRHRHNYSGNYVFHLEATTAQTYALDNTWNGLTLEVCDGGAIRLLSAMGCSVDGAQVWDLDGNATNDLFIIGKSATGSISQGNTLRHLGRRAGNLGAGVVDVRLVAGQVGNTTLDQCFDATLNDFKADLGNTTGTIIGRPPAILTNADRFANLSTLDATFESTSGRTLTVGETVFPREAATQAAGGASSGVVWLSYFTAKRTETVTSLETANTVAAGATPTLCRMGLYQVEPNDSLTLIGATANDTSLWGTADSLNARPLQSPVQKVRGQRYAVGVLVVTTATAPTLVGFPIPSGPAGTMLARQPRVNGAVSGQVDLPATVGSAGVATATRIFQARLIP